MRITVKVRPNSKEDRVERTAGQNFTVRVKEKALENRANKAVVDALSDYFNIPKSRIFIVRGLKQRIKIIDIS